MPAIIDPVGPPGEHERPPPWPRRIAWFAGLALAGVALTAGAAALLHVLMRL